MELKFRLTEEDYINYNIEHAKRSPSIRKSILFQRLMGPAVFIIAPFVVAKYSEIPLWYWITLFGITTIVWLVFYPKYANWEMKTRLKKMMKEKNHESLLAERTLILTQDGITEESPGEKSSIIWEKIVSLEETEDYIHVYISPVEAHVIPKRVFKDQQSQSLFIEYINEHISSDKRI
nr:YcxB family protein [Tissierella sp.]